MASAITHFIVGGALALPFRGVLLRPWTIPVSSGLMALAPDLDTFAMRALDIPYSSFFGHRGFFHSPFFLILLSTALAAIVAGRAFAPLAILWACCAITHPLLDALTDGGLGVMLLFPFSDARLFFPWRPIYVSPLSIASFFDEAGDILQSEMPFDIAAIAIGVSVTTLRRRAASGRR
jgi:inner membrane protein